jgi:hypothetical protein
MPNDAAESPQEAIMFLDSFSAGHVYWGRTALIIGAVLALALILAQLN